MLVHDQLFVTPGFPITSVRNQLPPTKIGKNNKALEVFRLFGDWWLASPTSNNSLSAINSDLQDRLDAVASTNTNPR